MKLQTVNINTNDVDLLDTIGYQDSVKGGEPLNPMARLHKVFKDGLEDEHLHIVMVYY